METVLQDLRYAWRHIRRSPGFAIAAVLTLALGIGANTAMFSMLSALTMQRLAITDPDELIAIAPRTSRGLPRSTPVSAVAELERNGPLQHLCGYLGGTLLPVIANGAPAQVVTTFVTAKCFDAFGVRPVLGRTFTESEAPVLSPGARLALISHRLWTSTFAADPAVLGKSLRVNNVDVTVIGVLPRGFIGVEVDHGVDIFTPFDSVIAATGVRRQLAIFLLGRLRPGVTLQQATAEIETRWPALIEAVVPEALAPSQREQLRDSIPRLERMGTGRSRNRERYVQPLTLILGLTSLLLLLACVNLGGLLLARLTARSSELAVRLALGGTRRRIAQQMVIESLVLSFSGAALGVPVGYLIATTLASLLPPDDVPYTMTFAPDARVLAATVIVGLLVGMVMSAVPIWMAMRQHRILQFTWNRTVAGATNRWGRVLVVAQVALSVVLLVGATLLTRSLYLLQRSDLGIRTAGILNVKLFGLPNAPYNRGGRAAYYPALLDSIAALPSVRSVALAERFPRMTTIGRSPITFVGDEPRGVETSFEFISPSFPATMGIPLLAGRNVTWADTLESRPVTLVSESLARALSADGNVLERRVRVRTLPVDQEMVIVGVVGDATQGNPRVPRPHIVYRPALQIPATSAFDPNLLIETSDVATVSAGVRRILQEGGRDYAQEIISVDDVLARAPASERMSVTVAVAVGALAVALALIGVHGALAYSVSRRRREIGVRVAIGASPTTVALAVVRDGFVTTAVGVALGLPVAYLSAGWLRTLLFEISEVDLVTFAGVALFFLVLGAVAGLMPARRAAAVDPMLALRAE